MSNSMNSAEKPWAMSLIGQSTRLSAAWRVLPRPGRLRIAAAVGWIVVVTVAFVVPLTRLIQLSLQSELNSYIPVVPFVTAYLLYSRRRALSRDWRSSFGAALIPGIVGLAALMTGIALREAVSVNDYLTLMTLAYVNLIAAGGFLFLGSRWMATAAFPVAFLIFMVPLPDAAVTWLETALVLASAEVAALFFQLTGTPLLRRETTFRLPGIVLEVARECSGIRSTWVLFMTSLLASHMFLKGPWRKLTLVAFVIPLGIGRNAFRILVIGLLCVHVGPHMADSFVHTRGGPIFFALSLGPLLLLLLWLRRRQQN